LRNGALLLDPREKEGSARSRQGGAMMRASIRSTDSPLSATNWLFEA
jgi:hypothetical protein